MSFGWLRLVVEQSDAQREFAQGVTGRTTSDVVTVAVAPAPGALETLFERQLLQEFAISAGADTTTEWNWLVAAVRSRTAER